MNVTIYHNPRCSKSRQTLQLLTERGIEARVVEYLKTPPGRKELQQILTLLKMQPRELLRKQEPIYKTLGLDDDTMSDSQIIEAMVENPVLIERPIVLANRRSCAVATDFLSSRDTNTSCMSSCTRDIRPPWMAEVSIMQEHDFRPVPPVHNMAAIGRSPEKVLEII